MLRFFVKVFLMGSLITGICLLFMFFSNEAFAASCTDQMLRCFPSEGSWISGIIGAAKCILQNFVCMINKLINIFR